MDVLDWKSIIEQEYGRIRRSALLLTGTPWDAEDLAQETFLEAMRSGPRFAGRSGITTWLYSILLNRHRRSLRSSQRRWRRWLRWFSAASARPAGERPEARLQLEEWQSSLWSQVARLPEAQQHVVVLRHSEGLSYEQVAEAVGCPVGTVRSRLHHALRSLRRSVVDFDVRNDEPPSHVARARAGRPRCRAW